MVNLKTSLIGLAAVTVGALSVSNSYANDYAAGKTVFQTCSACHLPTGDGIPGAFPPLKNRVAAISTEAAGRDYLVHVVLNGLSGPITADGANYNGFMQAYSKTFNDQQIADVLNYVTFKLSDQPSKAKEYTAEEVAAIRADADDTSAQHSHELRSKLTIK